MRITTVSIFDVIGPVMVGPSSSHSAGAARLGNLARRVCDGEFSQVDFYLHGSFAETYRGHGTDKALLGGILGMNASDERIRESFKYADQQGIKYNFYTANLGDVHPNTVKIVMYTKEGQRCEVIGSSIGGGKIKVTSINDMVMEITGQYPTIIISHLDQPGIAARITSILAAHNINIAFLRLFRQSRGHEATMVLETDQKVDQETLNELSATTSIQRILFIDAER